MLNIIKSIQLIEITPSLNIMDFDRTRVSNEDASVTFTLRTEFAVNQELELCRLSIGAEAIGHQDGAPDIFKSTLEIDYGFKITDLDAFSSLEDEERLKLACNYSYLDFRERLTAILKGTGMVGIELPLSMEKLTESH